MGILNSIDLSLVGYTPGQPGFLDLVTSELGNVGTDADGFDAVMSGLVDGIPAIDTALGDIGVSMDDLSADTDIFDAVDLSGLVDEFNTSVPVLSAFQDSMSLLSVGKLVLPSLPAAPVGVPPSPTPPTPVCVPAPAPQPPPPACAPAPQPQPPNPPPAPVPQPQPNPCPPGNSLTSMGTCESDTPQPTPPAPTPAPPVVPAPPVTPPTTPPCPPGSSLTSMETCAPSGTTTSPGAPAAPPPSGAGGIYVPVPMTGECPPGEILDSELGCVPCTLPGIIADPFFDPQNPCYPPPSNLAGACDQAVVGLFDPCGSDFLPFNPNLI